MEDEGRRQGRGQRSKMGGGKGRGPPGRNSDLEWEPCVQT